MIQEKRHLSTSVADKNVKLTHVAHYDNQQLSMKVLTVELGISVNSIHIIVHDVPGKHKLCTRFVPHSLAAEQKEQHVEE